MTSRLSVLIILFSSIAFLNACMHETNSDDGGGGGDQCCSTLLSSNLGSEFTGVAKDETATATITISNSGSGAATEVALSTGYTASDDFDFLGGSYPGTGGTCGARIEANESCTVVVEYTPTSAGEHTHQVDLQYYSAGTNLQMVSFNLSGSANELAPTVSSYTPTTGVFGGGYTVTFTGANFIDGATTITFGDKACTDYVYTSETEMTCTIPFGNLVGMVDIVLTTTTDLIQSGGTAEVTETVSNGFTFTESAFGNAALGDVTLNSNTLYQIGRTTVASIDSTGKVLTVKSGNLDFAAGDEVLWHVRAASSDTACGGGLNLGNWGFARVASSDENALTVTLDTDITNGNAATVDNTALAETSITAGGGTTFCTLGLQEVQNFNNLTLTDDSTGYLVGPERMLTGGSGILAFKVNGSLNVGTGITFSADNSGFEGGDGTTTGGIAKSGDGSGGEGSQTSNSFGSEGGGGGISTNIVGAGGGANGANGGASGGGSAGGTANTCASSGTLGEDCLFHGGGGGGGASGNTAASAEGGWGGGIIIVYARDVASDIVFSSQGESPSLTIGANNGHFGGGAGGAVFLAINDLGANNITVDVSGGDGHGYGTGNGIDNGGGGGGAGTVGGAYCSGTGTVTVTADGGAGGEADPDNGLAGSAGDSAVLAAADSTKAWCE